jgi:hypothetical protein
MILSTFSIGTMRYLSVADINARPNLKAVVDALKSIHRPSTN